MHRAQAVGNLSKAGDEPGQARAAPPSPGIPPKRAKVTAEPGGSLAPVFVRKLKNAAIGTGCDIRLRVAAAGSPQPRLRWYKNDELLPGAAGDDTLWIRDCRAQDAGVYTCVARNARGEAMTSAVLAVIDVDGRPCGTVLCQGGGWAGAASCTAGAAAVGQEERESCGRGGWSHVLWPPAWRQARCIVGLAQALLVLGGPRTAPWPPWGSMGGVTAQ